VVGTGATAVQAIPEIAQQTKQLTVFQRTANYCVPARNCKVDPELVKMRKADYESVIKRIRESFFGFDAVTGPLKALNLKGRGGRKLEQVWADGPHTYLGISIAGFPNFFTITGPQSPSVLSNMPVSIEQHVEWIADCIEMMNQTGKTTIEAKPEAHGAHMSTRS